MKKKKGCAKIRLRVRLPGQYSGYDVMLPLQGAQVRSLVRELRSYKPYNMAKKKLDVYKCPKVRTVKASVTAVNNVKERTVWQGRPEAAVVQEQP